MDAQLRQEILTFLHAALAAEREACAVVAAKHQKPGQCIDRRIRDRPPFKLPVLAFEAATTQRKRKR